tara:strand:+ start:8253 stop:8624 length:372 start_codon:yes stop_codon:yes gene_type:complete
MNNMEKKILMDKNALFAGNASKLHYLRVSPNSDEYLKVWIKEPTWLQVEEAMTTVMKIDAKNQDMDIDLKAMYKYMAENFIEKTEPTLSTIDLLRLSPYIGNQLKDILPNPFSDDSGDEEKNE